jgi:hypothetical protein
MVGGGREGGRGGGKEEEEEMRRDRVKAAVARGVRLACGLEMLYWRSKGEGGREGGGEEERGGEWIAYVARLRGMGFWDGVMEGSKDYRERMTQAKNAFEETRRKGGAAAAAAAAAGGGGGGGGGEGKKKVCAIMDEVLLKAEGELKLEDFPKGLTELPADDDEEWMEMVPGELDKLLEKYGQPLGEEGGKGGMLFDDEEDEEDSDEEEEEGGREGGGEDLKSMVEGMKHFIGAMAGLEGAEVTGGKAASSSTSSSGGGGGGRNEKKKGEDVSFDVSRLLDILEGRDIEKALREGMMMGGREGGMVDSDDEEKEDEEGERGHGREGPMKGRVYMREGNAKGWRERDSDDEDDSDEEEEEEEEREGEEEEEKGAMKAYMAQMERELRGTTLAKTFDRVPSVAQGGGAGGNSGRRDKQEEEAEDMDEDEELPPVDVDLNLVRHLLESVAAQGSLPGPASNMLGEVWKSMGAE